MRNQYNITRLLVMILGGLPLVIIPQSSDYFYLPKILFVYVTVSLMFIIQFLSEKKLVHKPDTNEKILLIYLAWILGAMFFSVDSAQSFWGLPLREEGFITIISYAALFYFSKRYYQFKKWHLYFVLTSAVIVSVYGIFQFYGVDPIPRDSIRLNWSGRAFSTMGNPNFLGTYLLIMLSISSIVYLQIRKIYFLVISSILYWGMIATLTRSAWLGLMAVLLVTFFYAIKKKGIRKPLMELFLVFFFIIVVFNVQTDNLILNRLFSIGSDAQSVILKSDDYERAGANRIYIWTRTITLIQNRPLVGYGLENLGDVFLESYKEEMFERYHKYYFFDRAHNEYLHIAVSSGIPALLLYLTFVIVTIKKGFFLIRKNPFYIGPFIAIIGYLVQAFFNISVVSVAYIYWIVLGISINPQVFEDCKDIIINQ